jgi:hypothetical protein
MSRHYYEPHEIKAKLFLSYYLYSKYKYGKNRDYTPERIGSLSAYKALMQLYRWYVLQNRRIPKRELDGKIRALQKKADHSVLYGEEISVFINQVDNF